MSSHMTDLGHITRTGFISFCDIGSNFFLGTFFVCGIKFKAAANSSSLIVSGVILFFSSVNCNNSEDVNSISSVPCFDIHS